MTGTGLSRRAIRKDEVVKRRIAPDQQRNPPFTSKMARDRLRPGFGDPVVPLVHAPAVIRFTCVTHRQIEFRDARPVVGDHVCADGPPQFGEVGLHRPLARNEDEVGCIDSTDRHERELLGIAATDSYQGEREHHLGEGRP